MQCCCDYVLCTRRKINFYSILKTTHLNLFDCLLLASYWRR